VNLYVASMPSFWISVSRGQFKHGLRKVTTIVWLSWQIYYLSVVLLMQEYDCVAKSHFDGWLGQGLLDMQVV